MMAGRRGFARVALALALGAGAVGNAMANEGPSLPSAPINMSDSASLQRGARDFANYCLSCHSATYMRYSRLESIGLTEEQIKENLIFTGQKVGDTMTVALDRSDAKQWFGAPPPDLSVIARSRGPDWLYGYLRSFYRDDSTATGWNNTVFPKVGMPHVLWRLQGIQVLHQEEAPAKGGEGGHGEAAASHVLEKPGVLSPAEYDRFVADLVNYLVFMGEPARQSRTQMGILVIFFLIPLFFLTLALKKEFWKDIH